MTPNTHETRLRAALDAYPQGHCGGNDRDGLLVLVPADDLRRLLGDVHAYRETVWAIAKAEAEGRS